MSLKMKELPTSERPREKFKQSGFQKLSDIDLLSLLLRTGSKDLSVRDLATNLLLEIGSLNELSNTSLERLSKIKGVGEVKAITLLSALELGKRAMMSEKIDRKRIHNAKDLFEVFSCELMSLSQEHFVAVFLNNKNEIIKAKTIFIGSANRSVVHPRDIYKEAIKYSAVKLMCLHNHPSGDPTPSVEDTAFTSRLIEAGNLLQIPLLDHIIIGHNSYYSFYDHVMK
ncbi:MAG: DNA repair protein RadC [Bacilli bacterium]|nr:DNA repair protein RadC [Bacilli bacterium]